MDAITADALYQRIMAAFVEHWPDDRAAFLATVRPYAAEAAYPEAMARQSQPTTTRSSCYGFSCPAI